MAFLRCPQEECISKALQGRDIVAQARTGSGKTLAYILPALQRLLELPQAQQRLPWQTLILVPTRELCEQASALSYIQASGVAFLILLSSFQMTCEICFSFPLPTASFFLQM